MSVMVSIAVSQVGMTELIFVNPGVKVNSHIGADSTGATGAFAPVLIKEPGQRAPFAPVTFSESNYGLSLVTAGHDYIDWTVSQHDLSGCPSARPCVDLSVSKCFAPASTSTSGRSIQFLQFTRCCKETLNPAHPVNHSCIYDFKKAQHDVETSIGFYRR